jgi:hypothetical protein
MAWWKWALVFLAGAIVGALAWGASDLTAAES